MSLLLNPQPSGARHPGQRGGKDADQHARDPLSWRGRSPQHGEDRVSLSNATCTEHREGLDCKSTGVKHLHELKRIYQTDVGKPLTMKN